ncbi:MAG TPA: hypothetical protein VGB26_05120 [Nitrospiria bacterium]
MVKDNQNLLTGGEEEEPVSWPSFLESHPPNKVAYEPVRQTIKLGIAHWRM